VFGEESETFVMCCCSLHLQFVYKEECLACKVLNLKCKAHRDHHLILTPDLHHQRSRPHYLWLERLRVCWWTKKSLISAQFHVFFLLQQLCKTPTPSSPICQRSLDILFSFIILFTWNTNYYHMLLELL
jgi:hypothetical protein